MISASPSRYDGHVDLSRLNDSHTIMAELALGSDRVLDLGCATGALGVVLRERGSYVAGVELDPSAAEAARAVLDRVVVGDLESPEVLDTFDEGSFDTIIFGDVLEHLRDPLPPLARALSLLAPGGSVVASIPNVAHASVRLALLAGHFRYTPTGLLDQTHLRFFTRSAVQALFKEAGFTIVEWRRTTARVAETEVVFERSSVSRSFLDAIEGAPEALTYQFVVRATPTVDTPGVGADPGTSEVWAPAEMHEQLALEERRLTRSLLASVAELAAALPPVEPPGTRQSGVPDYICRPDAASDRLAYRQWIARKAHLEAADSASRREALRAYGSTPTISLLVPVFRPDLELLHRCVGSVKAQDYHAWELCLCDDGSDEPAVTELLASIAASDSRIRVTALPANGGISAATNSAASLATGEFIGLLDQDDELEPHVLSRCALIVLADPEVDVLYTDEDKLEDDERVEPYFKPDWCPDQLLSNMYMGHFTMIRRSLFDAVGGFRSEFDGSQDYDLALRSTEQAIRVAHLPEIGYHWRKTTGSTAEDYRAKPNADLAARHALEEALERRGVAGTVEAGLEPSTFRVRRAIIGTPLVSVIVPFHNSAELLRRCIASLHHTAGYDHWEALLVDNKSWEPETRAIVSRLAEDRRCRVVPYPEDFNWAALNNHAAQHAEGDHLLFLNVDVAAQQPGWMAAMLEHSQRSEVGAVGARLMYPDGRVQHAGVVTGLGGGVAGHAFCFQSGERPGYFCQDRIIRNWSAVTGACLMSSSKAFDAVGGFDSSLTIAYNDIDYCLRLRADGYLVVYTPFAELVHEESAARGRSSCELKETGIMFRRWANIIPGDPYFNRNLNARRYDFGLDIVREDEEADPWDKLRSEAESWWNRFGVESPSEKS